MTDLGQLIHDIRNRIDALDMPREKIAPKLGVTYSWLCKFMQQQNGATNPRAGTLQKVLDGLERIERRPGERTQ